MLNLEIAKIFYEMADILELQEVAWKPRAYRVAARALEALTRDVKDIYKKEGITGLEKIPGIGERLAKKIVEYIETGKIKEYEELKKQLPPGLEQLMKVTGLGPKRIKKLYEKLKIKSIGDLRQAIKQHKLERLFGFGEKIEKNILDALQLLQESKKRFLLGEAYPIAMSIVDQLKKLKEVKRIEVAGSLRRMKETVGDIDILVTATKNLPVIQTFVKLSEVKKVYAKGETRASVLLRNNIQCDLRVVKDEEYGSALQYFTGSKEHSIELRKIAIKKGYKLSEYGLFNVKTGKRVAGRTEEEIYKKLGFPWIPPELRENRGELTQKIPKLVGYDAIKGDLHMHTKWSDGKNSIEEMALAAKKFGYEYIAITDHSKTRAVAHGLDEAMVEKQIKEIKQISKKIKGIKILTGIEVDIKQNGDLDLSDSCLKKLDIVIAAIHSAFKLDEKRMTERVLNALSNENVNILGHPTGRIINKRPPYKLNLDKIFKFAAEHNVIMEIDAQPDRLDLSDVNTRKAILAGCKIEIGTDSHNNESFHYMRYGVAQARRGWARAKDIINTLPYEKLLRVLKRK